MNGSVVNMYDSDAADGAPDAIQQWREGNNNRGGGGADGRKEYTQYLTSLPTDQQGRSNFGDIYVYMIREKKFIF